MTYYYQPSFQKPEDDESAFYIRGMGLRVTQVRLRLMRVLSSNKKPLPLREIADRIKDHDESTIQRNLDALIEKSLVKRYTFNPTKSLYEINVNRPHHHHLICTRCGFMEDVLFYAHKKTCVVLPKPKIPASFYEITDHSLEFFGVCAKCH